ncbi:MAG: DUF1800 domain-containing protein [Methylococcus sp.]|nr:DUF1800 domain-containing protein [Methylococcus sp.]
MTSKRMTGLARRLAWSLLLGTCSLSAHGAAQAVKTADAVRFLEQSSFGPAESAIAEVQARGFGAWLAAQRSLPASRFPDLPEYPGNSAEGCPKDDPATSPTCYRDHYTQFPLQVQFFLNALSGKDQLRQRVAFSLSQIIVVSGAQIQQPSSLAPYLNLLVDNAFGNYRDLLEKITLNPAMGDYLDMANNDKPSADGKSKPNENYAREILQLFSIGLYLLNTDGTLKLDSSGRPIPTYGQDTIGNFARVFTGWTYAPKAGAEAKKHNPRNYLAPLVLYRLNGADSNHDKGSKQLLNYTRAVDSTLPANQDGETDLQQALDNIFQHPNVGPFIAKRLIQNLVTSNPSPAYVGRAAKVFNNNGSGMRGDLFATVQAILLDREARGAARREADYGRLREPVQFVTNLLRAFNARSDGVLADLAKSMGQFLFYSPSVFNYYPHEYTVPGTTAQGPEFGIESSAAALNRANFVYRLAYSTLQAPGATTGTSIDLSGLNALGANPDSSGLIAGLNRLLMHDSMSQDMKTTIAAALPCTRPGGQSVCTEAHQRVQIALYLVATSSQYLIQR